MLFLMDAVSILMIVAYYFIHSYYSSLLTYVSCFRNHTKFWISWEPLLIGTLYTQIEKRMNA